MKFELSNTPYLFAAGFSVASQNTAYEDCVALELVLSDLFNLRFNKNFAIIGKPEFPSLKTMVFTCRMTTDSIATEETLRGSIEARFRFECDDVEINHFNLICEGVHGLQLIDMTDRNCPKTIQFADWSHGKFYDHLNDLMISLAKLLSANPVRLNAYFENGGFVPFRELEDHIEQQRKLNSAYSLVKAELKSDAFVVEKPFVVRSLTIQDIHSTEFLKNAYVIIGDEVGMLNAVLRTPNIYQSGNIDYKQVDLDACPDHAKKAEFYMSNNNLTGFLKISSIEPISLEDLQASSLKPEILDMDIAQPVGV